MAQVYVGSSEEKNRRSKILLDCPFNGSADNCEIVNNLSSGMTSAEISLRKITNIVRINSALSHYRDPNTLSHYRDPNTLSHYRDPNTLPLHCQPHNEDHLCTVNHIMGILLCKVNYIVGIYSTLSII